MLHFLLEKACDDVFGGSIKAFVFKLALVLQSATSHFAILHLFSEVFERQAGSHHLVDAAAQSPPVHRRAVVLLPQDLRSHVTRRTGLTTHRGETERGIRESSKGHKSSPYSGGITSAIILEFVLIVRSGCPLAYYCALFYLLRDCTEMIREGTGV